jgi:hypothetical protein
VIDKLKAARSLIGLFLRAAFQRIPAAQAAGCADASRARPADGDACKTNNIRSFRMGSLPRAGARKCRGIPPGSQDPRGGRSSETLSLKIKSKYETLDSIHSRTFGYYCAA